MKKILGLDLGTTSISWSLVLQDENSKEKSEIKKTGVRAIQYESFSKVEKTGKSQNLRVQKTILLLEKGCLRVQTELKSEQQEETCNALNFEEKN